MDFPFVLPYNKRNYSPQGKRRTTMLYPIMNRSRSLIDLGGIQRFIAFSASIQNLLPVFYLHPV